MTTITRWHPFRDLANFQEQFNQLIDNSLGTRGNGSALTAWSPAVDIYETENELVMKADLPDLNEKDLDVRVENNMLTIQGERKFEKQVSEENYLRVERAYGSFTRSFSLPNTVSPEGVKADYSNGVLTVTLPKRAEAKAKQVKVNVSKNQN